ncbi:uncharacterized protein LOC136088954 [Hydra vulgaris]|uniref:Uncharacterized protein LOC136088954 n=1 Tax=Hydra vulgaris TaxID=6087 RepID=A0ABM4D7N4_HYDVU
MSNFCHGAIYSSFEEAEEALLKFCKDNCHPINRDTKRTAAYSIAMKIANILSDESKATFPQALQYLNSIEQQVIRGEWQQHNQIPDGVEAGVTTSILSSLRNSNVQGFETQSCLVESESVDGENLDKVSAINIF